MNCFWGHKWSKWVETKRGFLSHLEKNTKAGEWIMLERQCGVCGYKEIKSEKAFYAL